MESSEHFQSIRYRHLLEKRRERLRFELTDKYTINNIDFIDEALELYGKQWLSKNTPYREIFDTLSSIIEKRIHIKEEKSQQTQLVSPKIESFIEREENKAIKYPEKRVLPVKPKEKIFDEWAAVVRHKDEKDKMKEEQQRWQQKEKQREYWNALSRQREEAVTQYRRVLQQEAQKEHELFFKQQEKGTNVVETEKQREQQKKMKAMEMMKNNIIEKERAHQNALIQEKQEITGIQNHLKKLQEDEHRRLEEEKQEKARIVGALKQSYDIQNQIKKEEQFRLQTLDKEYLQRQEESAAKVEHERKRFFDHMRKFQDATLAKERQFENLNQETWEDKLHVDELRQAQYMKEKEERDIEREKKEEKQKQRDQLQTHCALGKQLEDKRKLILKEKLQEQDYAYKVKLKIIEEEQKERNKKEEKQKNLWEYRNSLQAQIEAGKKKKIFEGIMSEHERKVNQAEIDGYENMDTFGLPPSRWKNTIPVSPEMELARKINPSEAGRRLNYRSSFDVGYYGQPKRLVEIASRNMQDPQISIMHQKILIGGTLIIYIILVRIRNIISKYK